jgi:hypothetical protein
MENKAFDSEKKIKLNDSVPQKKVEVISIHEEFDKHSVNAPASDQRASEKNAPKTPLKIKILSRIPCIKKKFPDPNRKPKIWEDPEKKWREYKKSEKIFYIIISIIKVIIFFVLLYFFLLSLNFMTIGFTLISADALKAGDAIKFILANPFAALSLGIILTAIMQNATATTSIAVSMVGARIIPSVKQAIPIVMGSNIGKI